MSEIRPNLLPLVRGMLEEQIITFGKSSLKSRRESTAYVSLRDMISFPELFNQGINAYAQTIKESRKLRTWPIGSHTLFLEAIPEAATPYGGAVARQVILPLIYRRVKAKEHGQPRAVEGRFKDGDEVILLDDVITTASSKIAEAEALAEFGLKTIGAVVLVDREQGGRTELQSHGIAFEAAMTLSSIAKYALDERLGGVTPNLYDDLLAELDPSELAVS